MGHDHSDGTLVIDCSTCSVRGTGCADCVVTVLLELGTGTGPGTGTATGWGHPGDLGTAPGDADLALDADEARALAALASGGLLPPLRHTAQTG